jgi:hypothetical protein
MDWWFDVVLFASNGTVSEGGAAFSQGIITSPTVPGTVAAGGMWINSSRDGQTSPVGISTSSVCPEAKDKNEITAMMANAARTATYSYIVLSPSRNMPGDQCFPQGISAQIRSWK